MEEGGVNPPGHQTRAEKEVTKETHKWGKDHRPALEKGKGVEVHNLEWGKKKNKKVYEKSLHEVKK